MSAYIDPSDPVYCSIAAEIERVLIRAYPDSVRGNRLAVEIGIRSPESHIWKGKVPGPFRAAFGVDRPSKVAWYFSRALDRLRLEGRVASYGRSSGTRYLYCLPEIA